MKKSFLTGKIGLKISQIIEDRFIKGGSTLNRVKKVQRRKKIL